MSGIVIAIVGLGLLIAVHEYGHFIAGKLLGVKVIEFVIGFPIGPKIASVKKGETTYGISAFLFGGYVKFAELLSILKLKAEAVNSDSPAAKAGFKEGDIITKVGGADVDDWQEAYKLIYDADKNVTVSVLRNGVEEELAIDSYNFTGIAISKDKQVDISEIPRTFEAQKTWKRAAIVFAGPLMNLILAVILVFILGLIGFPETTTTLKQVMKGSPAAVAGMRSGDKIVEVEGKKVGSWNEIITAIQKNAGKEIDVAVERDGKLKNYSPTLRKESDEGLLGIETKIIRRPNGPVVAAKEGLTFIWMTTVSIGGFFQQLVTEPSKVLPFVRSPIGIVRETAPIAQRDVLDFLVTLAGISVAISIFNLIPIPPLDGGRLFISMIEGIMRRQISREAMLASNAVGISLLLLLMTYAVVGDILRKG